MDGAQLFVYKLRIFKGKCDYLLAKNLIQVELKNAFDNIWSCQAFLPLTYLKKAGVNVPN